MTIQVPEHVPDVDIAFGNIELMPEWEKIPDAFRDRWDRRTGWNGIANLYFRKGELYDLEALDLPGKNFDYFKQVVRLFAAWMKSFQPKHEHKIAACAWLLSENFKLPEQFKT